MNLPNWQHSECDILRAHIISALDFVDFISFCHNDAVVLQNNRIRINARLNKLQSKRKEMP